MLTPAPPIPSGRRALLCAALATWALGRSGTARAADPLLWLVAPDQTGAYAQALAALREGLPGTTLRSLAPNQLPASAREAPPALIITLGSAAYGAALPHRLAAISLSRRRNQARRCSAGKQVRAWSSKVSLSAPQ